MATREIIIHPNDILRHKTHKITDFGKEFQTLVDDMIETLRDAPGVGLAAPQVAQSLKLIVVEFGDEEDETIPPKLYVLANPEIIRYSEEVVKGIEGCLSIPEFAGEVNRSEEIVVRGQNRHGKPIRIKAKGWLARVFQHEIDHLNGILFIDRAEKVWKVENDQEAKALAAD